jgi:hypothetical protein
MPKKDPSQTAESADTGAPPPAPAAPPALGEMVRVLLPEGRVLRDSASGGWFIPGVPTWQRVDLTLLKRLEDGDLTLAA